MKRWHILFSLFVVLFVVGSEPLFAADFLRRCQGRLLELMGLPAEGRFGPRDLAGFDTKLARSFQSHRATTIDDFESVAQRLEFHLFPSQMKSVRAGSEKDHVVGFDNGRTYLRIWPIDPDQGIPRAHYSITRLPSDRFNPGVTSVINLPNLFIDSPAVQKYRADYWSGLSGPQIMGDLLKHEWIHSKQFAESPWGVYLADYEVRRLQTRDPRDPLVGSVSWMLLNTIFKIGGNDFLSQGAKLLNEFQAQSLVSVPGVPRKQVRELWVGLLSLIRAPSIEWKAIEKAVFDFQTALSSTEVLNNRYAPILTERARQAAIWWLRVTAKYPHSYRRQAVLRAIERQHKEHQRTLEELSKPKRPRPSGYSSYESGFKD